MDVMSLRRGLMIGMANSAWTYEFHPTDSADNKIQAVTTRVEAGQTVTISWDADANWKSMTNMYLWRCIGAAFDGESSGYTYKTMANMSGQSGEETHTVTTAGNIIFGSYQNGLNNNCFVGKFIKVRIENPQA